MFTTLYILFDPIITCANVLGNGAFAMIVNNLQGKLSALSHSPNQGVKVES